MSQAAADRSFDPLPDGTEVRLLTIGSAPGPVVEVLTLGATVHRLEVTGGDGSRRNVVLGHADTAQRLASGDYLGGTVGRYANRIAAGRFEIDGREVVVGTHDRGNSLHGGPDGFDQRVWDVVEHTADEVVLSLESPDGDQGFPGTVAVRVTYRVDGDTVAVVMEATTDAPTVVNLTNHAYFNLDGEGAGTIDDHVLTLDGRAVHAGRRDRDPARRPRPRRRHALRLPHRRPDRPGPRREHPQLVDARGIDHNFVIDGDGLRLAAVLESPRTGTRLELRTDQPGLQAYTGNFLDGTPRSTTGGRYRQGDGVALEPQLFPDTPNHPEWPSAVLRPGETYRSVLEWDFSPAPQPAPPASLTRSQSPAASTSRGVSHEPPTQPTLGSAR